MNIGDRVRLIRDREEGIITKILDNNLVEVSIEEGFNIPVLKQDLALVSKTETDFFGGTEDAKSDLAPERKIIASEGIFLAFEELDHSGVYEMLLVNNTDFECPFTVKGIENNYRHGIATGFLKAKTFQGFKKVKLSEIDTWPEFELSVLFNKSGRHREKNPFFKSIKFKSRRFFRDTQNIPVKGTKGFVFQIDAEFGQNIHQELSDNIEKNREKVVLEASGESIPDEIDLHFEVLAVEAGDLPESQILPYQLEYFEKKLDQAISEGKSEITFIHGVGNGKLRMEMHRILSRNTQIRSYKDAQKEKFGYGATMVLIK